MTRHIASRGPDAQEIWVEENVGFGHAMLRTTWESAAECQPLTLDGMTWIAADCRIDARGELLRELAAHDRTVRNDSPDPELILHAYTVWGEDCIEHLLGDFSFAIWDGCARKLFAARDHFGVKSFFYTRSGATLIFSNTLNCVRLHPAVPTDLDEMAIADFLMYGQPLDLASTSFAAIRRLAPSHTLSASRDGHAVRRYWQMPLEEEIRYARRCQYLEHFSELLDIAVRDRLRTNTAGVFMSGGLDSPTLAVTAHRILSASGSPFHLRAHTVVFDRLVPDEERKYSQIAADAIGIPIDHFPIDEYRFPPREPDPPWYPPEPGDLFDRRRVIDIHRGPASSSRVLLRGDGADALIDALPQGALERSLRPSQFGPLLGDFFWLLRTRRQVPRLGIRTLFWKAIGREKPPLVQPYPKFFNRELELKLDLPNRARAENEAIPPSVAFELTHAYWMHQFERLDPGSMQIAAEARFPFVDLRLVRYLLRLPPIPWFVEKSLLRVAMRGLLPTAILRRPKTPLAGNPWALWVPAAQTLWWNEYLVPGSGLERFVDIDALRATLSSDLRRAQAKNDHADIDSLRVALRPIALKRWLQQTACGNVEL
jgi:asparagine synthase (glutamine-hydrolysing)